jgi:hypothetical protein
VSIGLDPYSSADSGAAVVDCLVASLAQVEPALRLLHGVRIRLLVKAVRGDRDRCGAALQRHALQFETVGIQRGEDGIAPPRHAADRGAFDDLRHVHGEPGRQAEHHGQRGEDGRVAGAAGDQHVNARREPTLEGAAAHLANDLAGRIDFLQR